MSPSKKSVPKKSSNTAVKTRGRGRPAIKKTIAVKGMRGRPVTAKKKAVAKRSMKAAARAMELRAKVAAAKAEAREAKNNAKAEIAVIRAELTATNKREAVLMKLFTQRDKAVTAYLEKWDKLAMQKITEAGKSKKRRRRKAG